MRTCSNFVYIISVITVLITAGTAAAATQIPLDAVISSYETWDLAGSPYHVSGRITIAEGARLRIEPGVEVRLEQGAVITVKGDLIARGSGGVMIHFLPEEPGLRWGNILFTHAEAVPSYNEQLEYTGGSILEHCVFEGGGNVPPSEYNGGVVQCIEASPVIQDCRFSGNYPPRGGAILVHRFSAPLIQRNTIRENYATVDDGGGICVFLYANPIIRENFLVGNRAARNGGGIYVSVANATIRLNTLIDNHAEEYGGGVYLSSSAAQIEENAFLSNHGWDGSSTLYLLADCRPVIRNNSLAGAGFAVYLDNIVNPVDLSENWWHSINEIDVELKIRRSFTTKPPVAVNYRPFLLHPPLTLPTQPVELEALRVMADPDWTEELRYNLAPGARVQVEVKAADRNPWSKDQSAARLYLLDNPAASLELILRETEIASGIFRGQAWIRARTNRFEQEIGAAIGDTLVIESTIDPSFHTQYHIGEAVPYVNDFAITSAIDITHIVDPRLEMSWTYFDLRRRPQRQIQIQIATQPDFSQIDVFDSGIIPLTATSYSYEGGASLEDGQKYYLRLRASDGKRFSPWDSITIRNDNETFSFRMNSLPPVPVPETPGADAIVAASKPILHCGQAADSEGDELTYEFEVFKTEFRRDLLDSGSSGRPQRQIAEHLTDNSTCWWRVRVSDGFETTLWSELVPFHVNYIEEPPAQPGLQDPFGEIASIIPSFHWLPAVDPDPQAQVHYYLQLSTTGGFADSPRLEAGEETLLHLTEKLINDAEYFWRVTAVDETGLNTQSKIGKFNIDTRPSLPRLLTPAAGTELGLGVAFDIEAAVDPDPSDQLFYDIQIATTAGCEKIVAYDENLPLAELRFLTAADLYGSEDLQDDNDYYWRVRATDEHGISSGWTPAGQFILNLYNDSPLPPQLVDLQAGFVVRSVQPEISWQPPVDPDRSDPPARLRLLLEFGTDAELSGELIRSYVTEPGALAFTPPEPLTDNSRWYLRLRVRDDDGAESEPVGPFPIIVNRQEDPPSAFRLFNPGDGNPSPELENVELSWQEAYDPDLEARVLYHVLVTTDPELQHPLFEIKQLAANNAIVPGPLPNATTYYWRVVASDDTGLQTEATNAGTFLIDTTPSTPGLMHQDEIRGGESLSWGASVDPSPKDVLLYQLQLWERGSEQSQGLVSDIDGTSLPIEEVAAQAGLPDNTRWEYSLTAVDNHGISSEATPRDWFQLDLVNESPTRPHSGDGSSDPFYLRQDGVRIEWSGGDDPDLGDPPASLTARVQLDADPGFASPLANLHPVPPGVSELELHSLQDNTRWYYRIQLVDDEGAASPWSDVRSFVVNLAEEPPASVTLLQPAVGARLVDLNAITVEFTAPLDPDYGDRVTSLIEIATDRGFRQLLIAAEAAGHNQRLSPQFASGSTYYLRVRCTDNTGLESYSPVVEFSVDSHPAVPRLLNPEPAVPLGADATLEWQESLDPDQRDQVRYRLEIARNILFNDPVVVRDNLRETVLPLRDLALVPGEQYYWRICAADNHDLVSEYCQPGKFMLR